MSGSGLVTAAVGGAVDVHERPDQALTVTLAEQLRGRHLLVVLDNCEHLVEACAELVGESPSACPQLHVPATGRVPPAVEGEATFEVAGLPVPAGEAGSASTVAAADAARLFEVRARQVAADFRIDDDNAVPVTEICHGLDGIPLAIELAAARVRVLAPGQIAAGLSDRFGLLTGGVRGAPARQRTLGASLDWSYDLLDDVQRLALARLSVFARSFELSAAEAVIAPSENRDAESPTTSTASRVLPRPPERSTSPPGHSRPGRPPSHVHARPTNAATPRGSPPCVSMASTPPRSYEPASSSSSSLSAAERRPAAWATPCARSPTMRR